MKDCFQPLPDQRRVARSFTRGLASYSRSAVAQAQAAEHLFTVAQGQGLNTAERIFEFGAGTGFLTQHLSTLAPSTFTANDLVPVCADGLRALVPGAAFHFLPGPVEALPFSGPYDVIASASTLQWLPDPAPLLRRLCEALVPGGWLLLSAYGPAHFPELRALGLPEGAPGYRDAAGMAALLPEGIEIACAQDQEITLRFDSARAVLRHLRDTGVNGGTGHRWGRADLAAFCAAYEARFGGEDGVRLTYAPSYLVARKR
ncbi:methyltransferase domain-containing protein [Pseudoruegeria sp. SHC-113]|uniref:methyltransferase domain-containing protein n=1 Tax=Pseudoruegeria sp. SHC-113 TaxID=2855439 RepID=UPI0021BAFDA6|nr:methyltransferase domain-containing protein [Pseudoruegeria sp. SHC-113]MCT8161412.1 methyltransferase domain-containing protein [Pseudoruegeria sp. SHC-113]